MQNDNQDHRPTPTCKVIPLADYRAKKEIEEVKASFISDIAEFLQRQSLQDVINVYQCTLE